MQKHAQHVKYLQMLTKPEIICIMLSPMNFLSTPCMKMVYALAF